MNEEHRKEVTKSLARLGFDEYIVCIANAALTRGRSTSKDSIRSLTELITALSGNLNRSQLADAACALRDTADQLERPLLDTKAVNK